MRAPIAKIRIATGNPGWYDPLTNIHLTITRPEAIVYEGSNVFNIKKAVSFKLVHVIEGELEPITVSSVVEALEEPKANEVVREVIKEEPKVEVQKPTAIVEEEKAIEEVQELVVEKKVAEKKPAAKKTTRKTTAKKNAE